MYTEIDLLTGQLKKRLNILIVVSVLLGNLPNFYNQPYTSLHPRLIVCRHCIHDLVHTFSLTQDKDRVDFCPDTQGITSGMMGLTLLLNFNCNGDRTVGICNKD